jgi:hypothetical protein
MTNNKYYSKRTQAYIKKHNKMKTVKNAAISAFWLMVSLVLVVLIVLDWLRVVRLSWIF